MKKKKSKIPGKLKKLVRDAIKRHAWNIGVSQFTGDIHWMDSDKHRHDDHATVAAEMTVDRRYLKFTMRIYPHAVAIWKDEGDEAMEEIIAHEVAHLATQHMMDMAVACYKDEGETKDAWETLTTIIGKLSNKIDELEKKKRK